MDLLTFVIKCKKINFYLSLSFLTGKFFNTGNMKKTMEYIAKAIEYLEKCEIESPYKNVVDLEQAKTALQIVELEHKIEEARQLHHYEDMEELKAEMEGLMKKVQI